MTAIIISNKEALISPEYQLEECKKLLNYNEEFKVFTTNEIEDFHSDGDFDDFEILLDSDKISKAIIYRFDVICDDYFDLLSYISRIGNYGKLLSCYEEFDSSTEGSKYIYKLFQLFSNQVIKYNLDEEFEKAYGY